MAFVSITKGGLFFSLFFSLTHMTHTHKKRGGFFFNSHSKHFFLSMLKSLSNLQKKVFVFVPKKKTSSLIIIIAYKLVYIIVPSEERAHTHTHTHTPDNNERTPKSSRRTRGTINRSSKCVLFISFVSSHFFTTHNPRNTKTFKKEEEEEDRVK